MMHYAFLLVPPGKGYVNRNREGLLEEYLAYAPLVPGETSEQMSIKIRNLMESMHFLRISFGEGDTGNLGGTVELKKWFEFLYLKDPEGTKRMTLRNLMESYVLPNNLVISENDICDSTNQRVQQCLPLAKTPEKPGVSGCKIEHYDTKKFNLGRCINDGIYCDFEGNTSCGDSFYCPQGCISKPITQFNGNQANCI